MLPWSLIFMAIPTRFAGTKKGENLGFVIVFISFLYLVGTFSFFSLWGLPVNVAQWVQNR